MYVQLFKGLDTYILVRFFIYKYVSSLSVNSIVSGETARMHRLL